MNNFTPAEHQEFGTPLIIMLGTWKKNKTRNSNIQTPLCLQWLHLPRAASVCHLFGYVRINVLILQLCRTWLYSIVYNKMCLKVVRAKAKPRIVYFCQCAQWRLLAKCVLFRKMDCEDELMKHCCVCRCNFSCYFVNVICTNLFVWPWVYSCNNGINWLFNCWSTLMLTIPDSIMSFPLLFSVIPLFHFFLNWWCLLSLILFLFWMLTTIQEGTIWTPIWIK